MTRKKKKLSGWSPTRYRKENKEAATRTDRHSTKGQSGQLLITETASSLGRANNNIDHVGMFM